MGVFPSHLYFLRIFRYLQFSFDWYNQSCRYLELTFLLVRVFLRISLITILTSENTVLTRRNAVRALKCDYRAECGSGKC